MTLASVGSVVEVVIGLVIVLALGWAIVEAASRVISAVARRDRESGRGRGRRRPPWTRLSTQAVEEELLVDAETLRQRFGDAADTRAQLLADASFAVAVDRLRRSNLPIADLIGLTRHEDRWVSSIALAALANRDVPDSWTFWVIQNIATTEHGDTKGLLVASLTRAPGTVVGPVLSKADQVLEEDVVHLVQERVGTGREAFDVTLMRKNVARSLRGDIAGLLNDHREELPTEVRDAFDEWLAEQEPDDPGQRTTSSRRTRDRAQKSRPLPYLGLIVEGAADLGERFEYGAASRASLIEDPEYTRIVNEVHAAHVRAGATAGDLIKLASDNRIWVHRIAVAVLARCDDIPEGWVRGVVRRVPDAPYDYAGLLALSLERAPGEVIGPVLAVAQGLLAEDMVALINVRIDGGRETLDMGQLKAHLTPGHRGWVTAFLEEHGSALPEDAQLALGQWLGDQIDLGPEVSGLVAVWSRPFVREPVLLNPQRTRLAQEIVDTVTQPVGRSVILIGESGVGKTALLRAAFEEAGWTVFEAQSSQFNAGAMFVGQLEGRVEELAQQLESQRAIWVFPNFQSALFTGAHMSNPTGLIDRLLPYVQRGALRIVAETTPTGYASLVSKLPAVASAFTPLQLGELDERETVQLCHEILESLEMTVSEEATLREAHSLAQQFLPGQAAPGNTLRLLRTTADRVLEEGRRNLEMSDVFSALSLLSGLPLSILDPSQPLGLGRVRGFLEGRVLGQTEAIDVVVDRIALVKAGLTDPTRPLGVFLFVGPTGTGKTELAKALAELVFGSAERLVRLDMSEYQTPDSLDRLLADADLEPNAAPLIAAVRRKPFSVVLLDEFEKAAPPVRDLVLQLFDDGRLTDRNGRTTDFRRCLVIMTSNVGSALQSGPGLGFSGHAEPFREANVERALKGTFRPEFLNRIDRIVVFRPFDRAQMRALLDKELDDVVMRRGMRDRPWAIELDESAISFLIEKGFTPDLGARPLKRAVEQYVLTPLGRAIADAQVPTGDQFLFLTATRERIDVQFVGLEGDERGAGTAETPSDDGAAPGAEAETTPAGELRRILRDRTRSDASRTQLLQLESSIRARVDAAPALRKQALLSETSNEGFWERDDRFPILAEIEYLDRLDAATRTADRLADRLRHANDPRLQRELTELLALRLLVLTRALDGLEEGAPFEVFVRVRPLAGEDAGMAHRFHEQVIGMYDGWATRHGMTIRRLGSEADGVLLTVEGLGAGSMLADEAGLHVCEVAQGDDAGVERVTVSVEIAEAAPAEPIGLAELTKRARATLDAAEFPRHVTRRYRFEPTPLVRDTVRGYRTGRIDRVLAGDFDHFT